MKNLHLEHLEDFLFDTGDMRVPIALLQTVFHWLRGQEGAIVSTKWDGAPAIVFGIYPGTDNEFFLGTKSAFSGAGKVAFKENEIWSLTESPQLREKLKYAYQALKPIYTGKSNDRRIHQADMIWWPGHKEHDVLIDAWVFQPNTLRYYVTRGSRWQDFMQSRVGIVDHTIYTGDSWENLSAEIIPHEFSYYDEAISVLNPTIANPVIIGGDVANNFEQSIAALERSYVPVTGQPSMLNRMKIGRLHTLVKQFVNYCYRKEFQIDRHKFVGYIHYEYSKEAARLKTNKGKLRKMTECADLVTSLDLTELDWIFGYYNEVVRLKNALITWIDLNSSNDGLNMFLPDKTQTGPEGYVVKRTSKGMEYFKLVNRQMFSRANMLNPAKDWVGK